jgi:hypothetical protein
MTDELTSGILYSKGSKEKKETGTRNSNNNNVKSNNRNAHIEGDTTVNSNTYKYYYNVFPNMRLPGPSSNSPSAPCMSFYDYSRMIS